MKEVRCPTILEEAEKISSTVDAAEKTFILKLHIPEKLLYFNGHFDQYPIVPGVAQISWAASNLQRLMAKKSFYIERIEALKFVNPLRPDDTCWMELQWSVEKGKASFRLYKEKQKLTLGRFVIR